MSLSFAKVSYKAIRGMTWNESIQLLDETGAPVDLTGSTLMMRLRAAIGDDAYVMELSTSNGRLIADTPETSGWIKLSISADDMLAFPENNHEITKYVYDATLIRAGSPEVREPIIGGRVKIQPQVTRSWEA